MIRSAKRANLPLDCVCVQKVRIELGHIAQFVGFQSVNRVVLFLEDPLIRFHELLLHHAEPLEKQYVDGMSWINKQLSRLCAGP